MRLAVCIITCACASASAQTAISLGPAPVSWFGGSAGRISAIAVSSTDPNLYFAAGADGGVWRTTDGGESWEPVTDNMPTTAIGALAIDPTNESIIYAGTGEANFSNHSRYGLGLYKSTDGGDTWMQLAEDVFAGRCFSRIVIDPTDTDTLYASITRAGGFPEMSAAKGHPQAAGPVGVFRSTDGGHTWTHLAGGLPSISATDLAIDPQNPDVLYAAIGHIFGHDANGVYKTTDGGASWTRLSDLPTEDLGRISVAVSPGDSSRVAALLTEEATLQGGGAFNEGVYLSTDGGETWSNIGSAWQASYGWYLSTISFRPGYPETVVAGGLNLVRITSGDEDTITPPHVDLHAVAWDAAGRLIAGDDGGVHRSPNVGNDWDSLNTNLSTIQFYAGLSTSPVDDEFIIGGAQDNGTNRRDTEATFWDTIHGGDGGWTQIDQASPNRLFVEAQGTGNLSRSTNFGNGFAFAGDGIDSSDRHCFLPPYVIDPTDSDHMLYATHRIYESINGGTFWTPISGDLTNGDGAIRALAMAPSNPDVVYAATNDGNVLVSFDGGSQWEIIRENHPGWSRVTRELFVHPTDPQTVYLAVAFFGTDQVLRSTNAGQTWESLDGDLPDIPVNVLAVDVARSIIYAGTDSGVYRSTDDGATWTDYGDGLPNACVIDLRLQPDRNRLIVGTQGRGAWEIVLCDADVNDDGQLDVLDFVAFQALFTDGDPAADCNGDGKLNVQDFVCFQSRWSAGCT